MDREPIPEPIRRYILACVASVPYLEAMLLIRSGAVMGQQTGCGAPLCERGRARENADFCENGVLVASPTPLYRYQPRSPENFAGRQPRHVPNPAACVQPDYHCHRR